MVNQYTLKVKHDAGVVYITTWASTEEAAIQAVMNAEGCPRRSIQSITIKKGK